MKRINEMDKRPREATPTIDRNLNERPSESEELDDQTLNKLTNARNDARSMLEPNDHGDFFMDFFTDCSSRKVIHDALSGSAFPDCNSRPKN